MELKQSFTYPPITGQKHLEERAKQARQNLIDRFEAQIVELYNCLEVETDPEQKSTFCDLMVDYANARDNFLQTTTNATTLINAESMSLQQIKDKYAIKNKHRIPSKPNNKKRRRKY